MTDLGQGKTLLPDTREENEIHPSGVNGVTTDGLAPGLAPGESAAPTLTVSLGGVRRAEAGDRLPRTPPGQRFLRQAAREGHPGGVAGPVLLLRLRTGGAGPRQSAFGSPAARRVSTAQLRPAQPGCSWRGARCQGAAAGRHAGAAWVFLQLSAQCQQGWGPPMPPITTDTATLRDEKGAEDRRGRKVPRTDGACAHI